MCTKNLHVDIWSWVIGHGELESGVYFDRGGRRAARFGIFSLPRKAAQRQRPAWFTAVAFSGCLWPSRAARRALKRARATSMTKTAPNSGLFEGGKSPLPLPPTTTPAPTSIATHPQLPPPPRLIWVQPVVPGTTQVVPSTGPQNGGHIYMVVEAGRSGGANVESAGKKEGSAFRISASFIQGKPLLHVARRI